MVCRVLPLLLVSVLVIWVSVAKTDSTTDEVLDGSFYGLEDDRGAGEIPATVLRPAMNGNLPTRQGWWYHRGPYYGHRRGGGPYGCGCHGGYGCGGYGWYQNGRYQNGRYGQPGRGRRSVPDVEERLAHLCRRLQSEQSRGADPRPGRMDWRLRRVNNETRRRMEDIWRRRRSEMLRCCNMETSAQKTRCVNETKAARFERICNGEEPACVWSLIGRGTGQRTDQRQSNLTARCCALHGEERFTCFRERMDDYRRMRFGRMMDRPPEVGSNHGEGVVTVTGHGSFTVETDAAAEQEVLDGSFYGMKDDISEVVVSTEEIMPHVPGNRRPQGDLVAPGYGHQHRPRGGRRHHRGPRFYPDHHHFQVHGHPRDLEAIRQLHQGSFPMPDIRQMVPDMTVEGRLSRLCSKLQPESSFRDARRAAMSSRWRRLDNETRAQIDNIWRRRRNEMLRCCNLETSEAKTRCVNETQAARYGRICNNEEPMCVWSLTVTANRSSTTSAHPGHPNLKTRCCALQGEERSACFSRGIAIYRMMRHGRGMGGSPSEFPRPASGVRTARRHAVRVENGNRRSRSYRRQSRGRDRGA